MAKLCSQHGDHPLLLWPVFSGNTQGANCYFALQLEEEAQDAEGITQIRVLSVSLGRLTQVAVPWGGSLKVGVGLEEALRATPYLRLFAGERGRPPEGATLTLESGAGNLMIADNPVSFRYRARSFASRRARTEPMTFPRLENPPCIFPA